MSATTPQSSGPGAIPEFLADVRDLMGHTLEETPLKSLLNDCRNLLGSGKMLRSRLIGEVGAGAGTGRDHLLHAAAAVEMIHGASLLHDDVIDGGFLRRNEPAFWVDRGISGAILVGDLLLFKALDLTCRVDRDRLTPRLIHLTGQVCQAESEQELLLRGKDTSWQQCIQIARQKTGALFAFAGFAAAGDTAALSQPLEEAGYAVGTAYQLADDILDANGDAGQSGKTLGTDAGRGKTTAVNGIRGAEFDPVAEIQRLCQSASNRLGEWPSVHEAWQAFMDRDMAPALRKYTDCYSV